MTQETIDLLKELADDVQYEHGFNSPVYVKIHNILNSSVVEPPNRNAIWGFYVDDTFVRWCGTLDQFWTDCQDYVSGSVGRWESRSKTHKVFYNDDYSGKYTHNFKAIKN